MTKTLQFTLGILASRSQLLHEAAIRAEHFGLDPADKEGRLAKENLEKSLHLISALKSILEWNRVLAPIAEPHQAIRDELCRLMKEAGIDYEQEG